MTNPWQQARNFLNRWNWTERMNEAPIVVSPAPFSVVPLASAVAGLSEKSSHGKVEHGLWIDERGFVRGSDDPIYISIRREQ